MNDVLRHDPGPADQDRWLAWPVSWSAVCVGALTALAVALVLGLIGLAIGAHVTQADPWVETRKIGWGTVIFSVIGAFLAFVAGGWVAGRIAGIHRSEPAMLHGAIVWLTVVPVLVIFAALGAGAYFGSWYGGLAGQPAWAERSLTPPGPNATTAEREAYTAELEQSRRAARNSALGALTALLLGLMGSVIGGWMASGEPMTLTYHKNRRRLTTSHPVPAGTA